MRFTRSSRSSADSTVSHAASDASVGRRRPTTSARSREMDLDEPAEGIRVLAVDSLTQQQLHVKRLDGACRVGRRRGGVYAGWRVVRAAKLPQTGSCSPCLDETRKTRSPSRDRPTSSASLFAETRRLALRAVRGTSLAAPNSGCCSAGPAGRTSFYSSRMRALRQRDTDAPPLCRCL